MVAGGGEVIAAAAVGLEDALLFGREGHGHRPVRSRGQRILPVVRPAIAEWSELLARACWLGIASHEIQPDLPGNGHVKIIDVRQDRVRRQTVGLHDGQRPELTDVRHVLPELAQIRGLVIERVT